MIAGRCRAVLRFERATGVGSMGHKNSAVRTELATTRGSRLKKTRADFDGKNNAAAERVDAVYRVRYQSALADLSAGDYMVEVNRALAYEIKSVDIVSDKNRELDISVVAIL